MELLKKADAMKEDCGRFVEVTLSNGFWSFTDKWLLIFKTPYKMAIQIGNWNFLHPKISGIILDPTYNDSVLGQFSTLIILFVFKGDYLPVHY